MNMSEYAELCVNMPKSVWMAFVLLPHCNPLSTSIHSYLFKGLHKSRSCSLKEYEVVFIEETKFDFF